MSITINGTDHDRLASFGLTELSGDVLSFAEFRNERESGYGDDEGEWFAVIDRHTCPDGDIVSVLAYGTHGNDHSPGASHYTTFEVFDPADAEESAEFLRRVREWQAMPERLDSEDEESEDDSADDVPNLDAMEPAELREWADEIPASVPEHARFLLASYARNKADAMEYRADGAIDRALTLERQCERTYGLIPDQYRW